jgi:hypothetical protein
LRAMSDDATEREIAEMREAIRRVQDSGADRCLALSASAWTGLAGWRGITGSDDDVAPAHVVRDMRRRGVGAIACA